MPGTLVTAWPTCGEICDCPWMSCIRRGPGKAVGVTEGVFVGVGVLVGVAGVPVPVAVEVGVETEQGLKVEDVLRGVGGTMTEKSAALLSVSMQPLPARRSLAVLLGA